MLLPLYKYIIIIIIIIKHRRPIFHHLPWTYGVSKWFGTWQGRRGWSCTAWMLKPRFKSSTADLPVHACNRASEHRRVSQTRGNWAYDSWCVPFSSSSIAWPFFRWNRPLNSSLPRNLCSWSRSICWLYSAMRSSSGHQINWPSSTTTGFPAWFFGRAPIFSMA